MAIKTLSTLLAVAMLLLTLELVRRDKLNFKYAAGWLLISLAGLFFAIFDQVLFDLARYFGFSLPSNFIFFMLLGIFVFLSLLMTVFLCQQNNRNDIIAQKLGLLELELKQLARKVEDKKSNDT